MPDILKGTFSYILKKYGHDVLLQHRLVDDGTGIYALPDGDEKNFFDTKLERWTTYSTYAGRKTSITNIQEEHPEGFVHTVKMVFYFQSEARPNDGDRIYQPDDRIPAMTFLIEYANPVRGYGGKVLYYEVGAVRENPK